MKRVVFLLVTFLIFFSNLSSWGALLFTGASGNLSASANFEVIGDLLTITLTNTATNDDINGKDTPANTLTGLKWNWVDSLSLTPVSALMAPGSIVQGNECSIGLCNGSTTNVGGEFGYNTNVGGFEYAVSSAGYIDLLAGNFNGPNLDKPDDPDGINFGIISNDSSYDPNGGLKSDPLIRNAVTLTLSGATGLSVSDIDNVSFQYGMSLSEPMFAGTPTPVPLPAAAWLFGTGCGVVALLRTKGLRSYIGSCQYV